MYSKLDRERILEDVKDGTPPIFFWDKIIINLISDIDQLEKELAAPRDSRMLSAVPSDLYSMKLHDSIRLPYGIIVIRVPGGWLWDSWDTEKDQFKQGIFIEYHNEFQ